MTMKNWFYKVEEFQLNPFIRLRASIMCFHDSQTTYNS